ncbi:MAG: hypothetical protein MR332_03795 [Fusicatenibacter sp.]|nr:hypothetical protein [Fusicatenibacter sp.]
MKFLQNPRLLENYLEKYQIRNLFDTKNLSFGLCAFEKGELVSQLNPSDYFLFLVEGTIEISAIHRDGSLFPIAHQNSFLCLGDLEFCGERNETHQTKAVSDVKCVVLSLKDYKNLLLDDNRFLRYLLTSVTQKMVLFTRVQTEFSSLEESLLYYLQYECPHQCLCGIEKTAALQHPAASARSEISFGAKHH